MVDDEIEDLKKITKDFNPGTNDCDNDVSCHDQLSVHTVLPTPPNGGLTAWLQVLAAFMANFNAWGIFNAFGVYQDYYQRTLFQNNTPFEISWIFTLSAAILLFGTNLFGGFVDLGYVRIMGYSACILLFAVLMLLSWSKTYAEVMLTQGLFVEVGSSLLFLLTISAIAPYFTTKRPIAIGIGAAGSAVGDTVYASMARSLIDKISTFETEGFRGVRMLYRDSIMLYSVGAMFSFIGLYIFLIYFETYSLKMIPAEPSFDYMTAIINAGSMIGRTLPAFLAVKVGPLNVLIPSELISMVLIFCWISAKSKTSILTLGVLLGMFSGPINGLPGTIVSVLMKDFSRLGIRLSFAFTFMSFGVVLGPPLAGIIQREHEWFWLKVYAAISFLLATLCHIALRFVATGPKLMVAA